MMNRKALERKFGHSMINICGSEGDIVVNSLGYPIFPDSLPYEYDNILRFDIERLSRMCVDNNIPLRNQWDILAVGFWVEGDRYEDPASDYAEHGFMRHIWNGTCEDYDSALEYNKE